MTRDPESLIEEYLERVRVYLPLGTEEVLTEIRTHLLEDAERIGQGSVTAGSVLMSIERFGEPKRVANEYAGTGKKLGPVPAEYTTPLFRILLTLLSVSSAFIIGAYLVGVVFGGYLGEFYTIENWPFNIAIMVAVNLVFAFMIIGGISLVVDREKLATERTTLESIFGVGSAAFEAKGRWDAAGEFVFGILFGIVLLLPQIQILLVPEVIIFVNGMALLFIVGAVKGLSFYKAGENNLNLLFEAIVSIGWIILALFLINFTWPLAYVYANDGTQWYLIDIMELFALVDEPFEIQTLFGLVWSLVVFIIAVTSIWKVLVAGMKIPMYLRIGKGWWWQGEWGRRYRKQRGFLSRFRRSKTESSGSQTNEYSGSNY